MRSYGPLWVPPMLMFCPPHQLPYDQQYQRTTERDLIADAYVLGPVNQSCRTVYVCIPLVPAL
jgi:hypothetical protein